MQLASSGSSQLTGNSEMTGREAAEVAPHKASYPFGKGCETIWITMVIDLTVDLQRHPSQRISLRA